jgi:DNA end-binding protein Ku
VHVTPQEAALAEKLVEGLATDFEPSKYHDEYQSQLAKLIEAKKKGQEVQAGTVRKLAPVIDLMQALQQSLGQVQKKPAASETNEAAEAKPARKQRARTAR